VGERPPDTAWSGAVARWAGAPVTVRGRERLTGGYVAGAVERIDLDAGGRALAVVLKRAAAPEIAAMRALAVVGGVDRPRLLAAGPDWLLTPYYDGPPLAEGPDVPDEVWHTLARVHAHWLGKRPRGLPVVDAAWWRHLCLARILPHVDAARDRTGETAFAEAATAVQAWADDPRMRAAAAVLPRTLVHGDVHRGNVLVTVEGAVLIDWGNAKVGPPGLDLPVLRAQGATDDAPYRRAFAELAGAPPAELAEVETFFAEVRAYVGYLGFAADHLGAARVTEMVDGAARALDALGPALAAAAPFGSH
jgi:hypothetical protein